MNRLATSLVRTGVRKHPTCKATITQPIRPSSTQLNFTTHASLLGKEKPSNPPKPLESNSSDSPELPAFSLEGLGVSKNMRIFLIGVLSIFGTIETWFWCKTIWIWWKGGDVMNASEKKS